MTAIALFRSRPAEVVLRRSALLPFIFCFLAVAGSTLAHAQNALLCTPLASPLQMRSEGIAERVGDIVLSCSGGVPGTVVNSNFTFFLSVNVTNKLAGSTFTDVVLTIDTGSGPTPVNVPAQPFGTDAVVFNGVTFTVPPSGSVTLQLSNLRADASQLGSAPEQAITANVAVSGSAGIAIGNNAHFAVGFTLPGLLATFSSEWRDVLRARRCPHAQHREPVRGGHAFLLHANYRGLHGGIPGERRVFRHRDALYGELFEFSRGSRNFLCRISWLDRMPSCPPRAAISGCCPLAVPMSRRPTDRSC